MLALENDDSITRTAIFHISGESRDHFPTVESEFVQCRVEARQIKTGTPPALGEGHFDGFVFPVWHAI